jgi:hypothetical protein
MALGHAWQPLVSTLDGTAIAAMSPYHLNAMGLVWPSLFANHSAPPPRSTHIKDTECTLVKISTKKTWGFAEA